VTRCTFRANRANTGSAIQATAFLEVTDCTFDSNQSFTGSGAIKTLGAATITGSTFRGNTGGALEASAALTATNCTFGGNSNTTSDPGIIRFLGSPEVLLDCTISANQVTTGTSALWAPGPFTGARPAIGNTIVAGNTGGSYPDVYGTYTSLGYNLIGNGFGSSGFGLAGSHDQVGGQATPIAPNLAGLADYGGPTWTMPPLPGSVAIDQGKANSAIDQRGRPRGYDQAAVPNAVGGDASDIGACELRPTVRTVTTTADAGAGSLRQTVSELNAVDADTLRFAPNVKGTITLTSGVITIGSSCIVQGPGAWKLAVDGNNADRVFIASQNKKIELNDLTVTGAKSTEGIAILALGDVTIRRCRVVGNNVSTGDFILGGVIREYPPGKLVMEDCTVANNVTGFGGGVLIGTGSNPPGEATFLNCTFSANSGPAVTSSTGTTILRNCTVTGNNTTPYGSSAALWSLQGPAISVGSSIVAGNSGASDLNGAFVSAGWNLIGKSDGSTGFTHGVNGDQVGTAAVPMLASLGPLQANGGPAETHALLPGSPALERGHAFRPLDQRGAARYDDPFVPNVDDGSDIGAYERNPNSPVGAEPLPALSSLALSSPRPNPAAGGVTMFTSRLAAAAPVRLDLYNVAGRRVRNLVRDTRLAGEYADRWDGEDDDGRKVPAGVYFARLEANGQKVSRSFVVLP
jgi:hypothetical protein